MTRDENGYCRVSEPNTKSPDRKQSKRVGIHVIVYEATVGKIPAGTTLDHICHTASDCRRGNACPYRSCFNPRHLEPVTLAENARRSHHAHPGNKKLTACGMGHELTPENTTVTRSGNTTYVCRTCKESTDAWLAEVAHPGLVGTVAA